MEAFTYSPTGGRVVFGAGASRSRLAPELERLGARRVLLIADRPFETDGVPLAGTFAGARAHVPAAVAAAAREAAVDAGADWLLCVGGGSVTGAAKAVALETGLPIAAVPTTYAGSELTPIYGITDGRRKVTGISPAVVPRLVVYDPDLLASLPPALASASAMNAMAHAVEALYGPGANPLTSLVAEGAIRALADGLGLRRPGRHAAGARSSRGPRSRSRGTGPHHRICHVLGGAYDLPHAELHAIVLPHAVALLEDDHPAEMALRGGRARRDGRRAGAPRAARGSARRPLARGDRAGRGAISTTPPGCSRRSSGSTGTTHASSWRLRALRARQEVHDNGVERSRGRRSVRRRPPARS